MAPDRKGRRPARTERARVETSAGGVIVRCTEEGPSFLLIRDPYKQWSFPKGHIAEGESPLEAARREVEEETGLDDLTAHQTLTVIDWHFRFRGRLIHKYCHYFLFESPTGDPDPQLEEGISECMFASLDEAFEALRYDNARAVLREAAAFLPEVCGEA
jgi:8-oxo-dGTP pyrophosphatase MutT (NUDIX family)